MSLPSGLFGQKVFGEGVAELGDAALDKRSRDLYLAVP